MNVFILILLVLLDLGGLALIVYLISRINALVTQVQTLVDNHIRRK